MARTDGLGGRPPGRTSSEPHVPDPPEIPHPVASGDWLGSEAAWATSTALRGVWNIVPTPFAPDGAVDTASIPGLVGFVRGTGVDGMTILGVLGEAGRLGDAERTAVLEAVLAAAGGSIPVCVGVSHASTDRAIALAREAQAAGAHSVMLAPPPLARPTDAALRRHYLAVAGAVDLPSWSRTTRRAPASR